MLALKPEVAVLVRSREFTLNAAQVARLFRQLLGLNKKVCPGKAMPCIAMLLREEEDSRIHTYTHVWQPQWRPPPVSL